MTREAGQSHDWTRPCSETQAIADNGRNQAANLLDLLKRIERRVPSGLRGFSGHVEKETSQY